MTKLYDLALYSVGSLETSMPKIRLPEIAKLQLLYGKALLQTFA